MNYLKNSDDFCVKSYYVLGYRVQNGVIYVYYPNRTRCIAYSKENERDLLYLMKTQIKEAYEEIPKFKNSKLNNLFWYYYNLCFAGLNTYIAFGVNGSIKGFNLFLAGLFIILNRISASKLYKDSEFIKEINKYIYFLNYEDEINSEIIKKYQEENENSLFYNPDDAPVITINDIHDTSIKELKETVELIRKSRNNNLN